MELNDLLSSLSEEDMEKLKATAAQLLGTTGGGDAAAGTTPGGGLPDMGGIDDSLLSGVSKFAGMMKEKDSRCDLLLALKPLLSEARRPKADEAITILRLTRLLESMRGGSE